MKKKKEKFKFNQMGHLEKLSGSLQTIVIALSVNTNCTYSVLMSKKKIYIYLHVMLLQHFVYCLPLKINKLDLKKNGCSLHRNIPPHHSIHNDRMLSSEQ